MAEKESVMMAKSLEQDKPRAQAQTVRGERLSAEDELRLGKQIAVGRGVSSLLRGIEQLSDVPPRKKKLQAVSATGVALSVTSDERTGRQLVQSGREQAAQGVVFLSSEQRGSVKEQIDTVETQVKEARETLFEFNRNLAYYVVGRFQNNAVDREDLKQEAEEGLLKAVDGYDWKKGIKFSSYAVATITGHLLHTFRNNRPIHLDRSIVDGYSEVKKARERLAQDLKREPTSVEIGKEIGKSSKEVEQLYQALGAEKSMQYYQDDQDEESERVYTIADPNAAFEQETVDKILIQRLLHPDDKVLSERSKMILRLRFYGGLTQSQIAEVVGLSQMHVSRLLSRDLATLRKHLTSQVDE
jgi:RNA polymerase sigma-B factor